MKRELALRLCHRRLMDPASRLPLRSHDRQCGTLAGFTRTPSQRLRSTPRRDRVLSNRLRFCESELLCENGVEHPRRKKSGQSPVLESLLNDCVACFRFCRAERHVDGFAQTLRGIALTSFVDDEILEALYRLPILGLPELTQIFFFAFVVHRRIHEARFDHY